MKKILLLISIFMMLNIVCVSATDSNDIDGDYIDESPLYQYEVIIDTQYIGLNESKKIELKIIANDGISKHDVSIEFTECAFGSYNEEIFSINEKGLITSKGTEGAAELELWVNGISKVVCVVVSDDPQNFDHKLYLAKNYLRKNDIMIGDENGNFNPEKNMTRSEFAKIICKFIDNEKKFTGFGCDFDDVSPDFWGYDYIMNANEAGLLKGYGNNIFGVNDTLTEEQAITVLCRMLGDTYEDVSYIETSVDEKGGYSEGYISIAGESGIDIEGLQKTVPATRARVAKWLYQLYNIKSNF